MTETAEMPVKETRIGIKNITGLHDPKRGTTRSFTEGSQYYQVEPGDSVAVPISVWNRIKNNRDTNNQIIWQQVPLSECTSSNSFRKRAFADTDKKSGVDSEFIETFETLCREESTFETAVALLSTCDSAATLSAILAKIVVNQGYPADKKSEISKTCVARIKAVKSTS